MKFIRPLSLAATSAILCCTLLTGCISQATIASLTAILGQSAASIASIEGNPTLAAKLTADTTAAVAAINAWKSGTPAQEVIAALNIVEDDLSLFPITTAYAPLIDLAIGTVESILALLPAPATMSVHLGRKVHLAHTPKNEKDYRKTWNATIASNPALYGAPRL